MFIKIRTLGVKFKPLTYPIIYHKHSWYYVICMIPYLKHRHSYRTEAWLDVVTKYAPQEIHPHSIINKM